MYLIDDIHRVLAYLRRDTHLVDERADILYGVIRCRIELVNIKRPLLVESFARFAFVACVKAVLRVETVDRLRKDTCAGGFTYSSRSAKQIGMRQVILPDGVL